VQAPGFFVLIILNHYALGHDHRSFTVLIFAKKNGPNAVDWVRARGIAIRAKLHRLEAMSAEHLKIGLVARRAGVGVQTLHYYERLGLLPKPERSAANYRLYRPDTIRRVQFIKKAQAIGMTLEETKQVLDLKDHGRKPCRQVAELGERHLREIDARLKQLRAYRDVLAQAVKVWRKENLSQRNCAGEFCDLIEQLP
jgi:DNA-binding transcriptional MerR regulator